MTRRYSRITGTGSFLPEQRISNDELAARLALDGIETSDQWIVEPVSYTHLTLPTKA